MVHFMQLDDRWATHLLTTLRALLGAAASFLFGQPKSFYLGQHLSFVLIGQISKAKWLKEQTPFIDFWTYRVALDFWNTQAKVKRQPGNQPECVSMLCLITQTQPAGTLRYLWPSDLKDYTPMMSRCLRSKA